MSTTTMEVTKENFRRMPLLLSRAEFLEVTGLDSEALSALVASGGVKPWWPPLDRTEGGGLRTELKKGKRKKGKKVGAYAKYLKIEAAKIAGVEEWLK